MIDSNSLRVGNLVRWNPKLQHPETTLPALEIEVKAINADGIEYVFPNIEHRAEPFEDDVVQDGVSIKAFNQLEPIMLTSEILERVGFTQNGNEWVRTNDTIAIVDDEIIFKNQKFGASHLHQLQNIYFDVVGEELEIDHS